MPMIGRPQDANSASKYANISMRKKVDDINNSTMGGGVKARQGESVDSGIIDRINGVDKRKEIYRNKRSKELGKNEFFKLLSHQLQNQDPMSPMDQTKMMGDLAQLSQLEQISHMRKALESQNSNQVIERKFYAAGLIGKKVYTSGSSINFKDNGEPASIRFNLSDHAKKVFIRVFDSKSNMVYQKEIDDLPRGFNEISWDGETLDGTITPKGTYGFQVVAFDRNEEKIKTETKTAGLVSGVEFQGNDPILIVGDRKVDLNEVEKFELVNEKLVPKVDRKELVKKYDESSKMGASEI